MSLASAALEARRLTIGYGGAPVVRGVDLMIPRGSIYALIGPAASGKTSLLRTFNLLALDVDRARVEGEVLVAGEPILGRDVDRARHRRRVGMVFATPQPLPGSIAHNLTFGPRLAGVRARSELAAIAESSLRLAQLWDEVKDRLEAPARALSGGQQQRLCLARTLALDPEIILLDEPCSGLDPIATLKIEDAMRSLRERITWVLVTNNTKQAARVSDRTAFLLSGELVEAGPTDQLFTRPSDRRTGDYLEGRFG